MNSDHLFEQAARLLEPPPRGAPRQADKRRAVSAAYYATFHSLARLVADDLVGVTQARSRRYKLVYRAVEHATIKRVCEEVLKSIPQPPFRAYWPPSGFDPVLQSFALVFIDLQEKRHSADYDPSFRISTSEAALLVRKSKDAVKRLQDAPASLRRLFLALLVFKPRL